MGANEKELKRILLESTPILFLGAGFSCGSKNTFGELPIGDGLRSDIFTKFIDNSFDMTEKEEVDKYTLEDLCQFIYDSLDKKEELQQYIVSRFLNSEPEEFHLLLNHYPWQKIYTVNVDDLVERIYAKNGVPLVVQNLRYEKKHDDSVTELFKLHGCVHELSEGLVFSRSEYTNLIRKRNFKLDSLTTDLVNQNIIFVGARLDERDIDFYISKYEDAGFQLRKGRLIFIDPHPNLKLKTRIKTMGGILLEWTTEQFLQFVAHLKYNPSELEASRKALNYAGFYLYRDILTMDSAQVYESRLYEGYACKWRDVLDDWVFDTKGISEIENICANIDLKEGSAYCVSIYGNRFVGKDCALKKVGAFLYKAGYDVIEFRGHSFNWHALKRYADSSPYDKFALLVEDASFFYRIIEKILQNNWDTKRLLVVTTSRTYYHFKKKYYLENNPFCEIELSDKIDEKDAQVIYAKLKQKGYTGDLPSSESEAVAEICKKDSYINLFSDITYGKGFRKRLNDTAVKIISKADSIFGLFLDLVIFDKADLAYYPSELFVQQYNIDLSVFTNKNYSELNSEQKNIVDFLRIDGNGLVLKNRLFVDMLWKRLTKAQIVSELKVLLVNISSYVLEDSNTYWRIIFESLLRVEVLSKIFKFNDVEILDLYYNLKDDYSEISYYWLQLGIAEQRRKDYSKALNHLLMAQKIKPKAYQIQHAIARNYLKNANDEQNISIAIELFSKGEEMMFKLINSNENYKVKAKSFSIHSFVHEKIKFYTNHMNLVNKNECKKMKSYIDRIINEDNPIVFELVREFMHLLEKSDLLGLVSMKPGDLYFQALSSKQSGRRAIDMDELDILVDSY